MANLRIDVPMVKIAEALCELQDAQTVELMEELADLFILLPEVIRKETISCIVEILLAHNNAKIILNDIKEAIDEFA